MFKVMGGKGRQPMLKVMTRGVRGVSHVKGDDKGVGVRGISHVQDDGGG